MEQRYTRISDLDDKIKSMSMPYLEWKVLFLISDNTIMDDILEFIDDEKAVVQSAVENLLERGLIEVTESAGEERPQAEEEPLAEKKEEEPPEEEFAAEELEPSVEAPDEIDLKEMEEEEESEEKTRIEVSAVEEEGEVEVEEQQEEEADDKTDLSGIFDEEEPETESVISETKTPPADEPAEEEIETVTGKKIMIIDDSIVIRKMIEIALEEENYHLINAGSGKEGMDSFEKDQPDLIILDMMLPDMNGIDLLKKIKEKSDTPVIMLSGKDSPQLVENAKEVGVNDFLPKPFEDEELVEKVKNLIN